MLKHLKFGLPLSIYNCGVLFYIPLPLPDLGFHDQIERLLLLGFLGAAFDQEPL